MHKCAGFLHDEFRLHRCPAANVCQLMLVFQQHWALGVFVRTTLVASHWQMLADAQQWTFECTNRHYSLANTLILLPTWYWSIIATHLWCDQAKWFGSLSNSVLIVSDWLFTSFAKLSFTVDPIEIDSKDTCSSGVAEAIGNKRNCHLGYILK